MNVEVRKHAVSGTPDEAHLLVVDDDSVITATLAAALRHAGYNVAEATTPTLALTLCNSQLFNLALVDERMPEMSGTQLARLLRDTHNVPVAFLSAYDNPITISEANAVGALGFFLKPIDPARMLPALHTMLGRANELRELRTREAQLKLALQNEREINTAVGILMERLQLGREAAFEALRRYSRSQRVQVVKVAGEILSATNNSLQLVAAIAQHQQAPQSSPPTPPLTLSRSKRDVPPR